MYRMTGRYMTAFCGVALVAALIITGQTGQRMSVFLKGRGPVKAQPEPAVSVEAVTYREDIPMPAEHQAALIDACEANNVPLALALGLIYTESRFQADADNGTSYGLCQLNRDYFPDGLSPEDNIRAGMEYLGALLAKYDTVEAALTSYNAGHDTGSRVYANAILEAAEMWR